MSRDNITTTSRRAFLAQTGAATLAATLWSSRSRAATRPPLCVFSKHLQFLDYTELARTCSEIGLDGIDLTVRKGGHVLPERVKEDLPKAVETIRAAGLQVPMITTNLKSGNDSFAADTLETASALGIPYFRIGGHRYEKTGDPREQLTAVETDLRSLAALAEANGMKAGYHNHSGVNYVGAPLWDLLRLYEAIGSPSLGSNFDIGHATVEGAYGDWDITARALLPHIHMVAVKDFVFEGRKPRWVPLGKGVVETTDFFRILRRADFVGPVSLHVEYKVASDEFMIKQIRNGVETLRTALRDAGY